MTDETYLRIAPKPLLGAIMNIVIKIGGSLCMGPKGPKLEYFKKLIPVLRKLQKDHSLAISIGGGKFVSNYFDNVKWFGLDDDQLEWVGIELMRTNQMLLAYALNGTPIFDLKNLKGKKTPILAGIKPRRSTDANAAIAAKELNADLLLILTDVRGVYDKNPHKNKNAKFISSMSFKDLGKYAVKKTGPKHYGVIDPLAIKTIQKNKINTIIFNGRDPKSILKAVKGKDVGTQII